MKLLIIFLILSLNVYSSLHQEVELIYEDLNRSYLLYVPENIIEKEETDLVIGLHGYTGTASGFESQTTGGFSKSADRYGFIAVYPQGLHFNSIQNDASTYVSSWNDLAGSKTSTSSGEICAVDADIYPQYPNCKNGGRCSWASCNNDLGFIKRIIELTKNKYNINNIYVLGMSNGGMMAQALACEYPNLFKAVVNVVGMQHKGLSCIPSEPINFIIYGGAKDTSVPPVTIKSSDGYFYEPMSNTYNDWSSKFNCKTNSIIDFQFNDRFTKQVAEICDNSVRVISLLNHDSGHYWPGIKRSAGFCHTEDQSDMNYSVCKFSTDNDWGNEFILDMLFNL
jgi:polyhydroxybutyrate depolymerase